MRYLQFISILPVEGEPHKVIREEPEAEWLAEYEKQNGEPFVMYESQALRINGIAVRIKVVEKEDILVPQPVFSEEENIEDFQRMVEGLVEDGAITSETLDEVKEEFRPIAEAEIAKQGKRGAPEGNQNAKAGKHSGVVIRLEVPTVDLLYDYFAIEGNPEPTRRELQDAVAHAVRLVYGRKIEDSQAMII